MVSFIEAFIFSQMSLGMNVNVLRVLNPRPMMVRSYTQRLEIMADPSQVWCGQVSVIFHPSYTGVLTKQYWKSHMQIISKKCYHRRQIAKRFITWFHFVLHLVQVSYEFSPVKFAGLPVNNWFWFTANIRWDDISDENDAKIRHHSGQWFKWAKLLCFASILIFMWSAEFVYVHASRMWRCQTKV